MREAALLAVLLTPGPGCEGSAPDRETAPSPDTFVEDPDPEDSTAPDGGGGDYPAPNGGGDYPAPDCAPLLVPGVLADVIATPREDHDAEVLALTIEPEQLVAPQARYEQVAADLGAIRALDPALEEVHTGCEFPNGIQFWLFSDRDIPLAIEQGNYHTWDCINAHYGVTRVQRIDGVAFAIELDGVYSEVLRDEYATIPELADNDGYWFSREPWSIEASGFGECTATAGAITLQADLLGDGSLGDRRYRFEHATGEVVEYQVTDAGPEPVE